MAGILQFSEFFVFDHDKTVVGKNIFDFSFDQLGPALPGWRRPARGRSPADRCHPGV